MSGVHRFESRGVLLVAILLGVIAGTQAQSLVTDRPDFTESGVTVPKGISQFEGGGTFSKLGGGHDEIAVGEALLRWGVKDGVEVRFGAPSFFSLTNGASESGLGDGQLGAKIELGPVGPGWDLAVIASTSVPLGDEAFSSDAFDPSVILTTGRGLNETSSIGGQIMVALPSHGDERTLEWGGTLVLGSSLGHNTGGFVEVAATVPESGTAAVVGHAGVTHRLNDGFQIDLHGGIGLSDTAPDAFVGVGLATQFR